MRLGSGFSTVFLICNTALVLGASWGFSDATVAIHSKGAGVGGGFKEKYNSVTLL